MEVNDEDRTDLQEQSSKSKQKKTLFCRLLMQKRTRVGCLTESDDTDLQESFRNNWPFRPEKQNLSQDTSIGISRGIQPTVVDSKANDRVINIQEYLKLDPPRDGNSSSTKLALCCAMTESSVSLDHPSNGHYLCKTAKGEQNITTSSEKAGGDKRTEISNKESCEGTAIQLAQKNNIENQQEKKCLAVLQQSSSINSESASSGGSSCDSSPPLLQSSFPPSRFRRRLLTQRRSADNLLLSKSCPSPSLRHSSPESSRSAPETSRQKKRSSSHDGMVPPGYNEELEKKEKRSLIVYRSTQGLQKAEGNITSHGIIASMDSLARHSLLAAQVLHLIPTTKARERNFLHGRIAANSLLGSLELERTLPQRELRIFVGTWNMNGQAPPHELNDFMLPNDLEHVPDVIAVGTQESFSERFEWEVSIQETIGPSHLLFHSASLGTLHLAIFMRRDLLWFCSVPEEASYSVRPGTAFKTKGAVAICFMLFGTSYLFITAHLTAHLEKVKERIQDVKRIVRSLDLPKQLPIRHKSKDVTQNFDCVFWCGDLNFRLVQPREEVVQWVSEQNFPLPQPHALQNDQLRNSCIEGAVFREFEEGPITFPPTYKYDPGTQQFDTSSKQRAPAYTDRILFKSKSASRRESSEVGVGSASHQPALECLKYTSVPSICTSDHKPVWGLYRSSVRPGIDTIPLAAGLFNREVYLEGIKRRAAALDKRKGTSTVCSIQ